MGMEAAVERRDIDGLTAAEVRDRVARGQVNRVPEGPSRTTKEIVRANLVTPFNILLGVLLVIVIVVVRDMRDALFGIVLVTNAAIGIVQELRAKATLDRLALLTAPKARVVREGVVGEIPIDGVVVDDVLELRTGDQLVVDGRILTSRGLEINESLLTGESEPVAKEPDHACLSGSFVVAGSGRYRASRVGEEAYAAALAAEAKQFSLVRSELREGIDWILKAISWVIGPVIILLVVSQFSVTDDFRQAVGSAVAGAVGMIPQGLVLLTSVAFAVGVIRLGRRNVLVQELPAIEGLARVDVVCFDKTGTLTEGRLVVEHVDRLDRAVDPAEALAALGAAEPDPNATLQAIAAAYPSSPHWNANASVPFSSARKWSGSTFAGKGTWILGAPEIVAADEGTISPQAEKYAADGQRVLLLSWSRQPLEGDRLPGDLHHVALVALGDRIRKDAVETLRYFADQGVQAKVISGDHPRTVAAIARKAGVPGSSEIVDARSLPDDDEDLADVIEQHTVFGRVTPYQKRRMVAALQSRGHVVAMTGDGVNDVLALKDADIGIAMGSGSSATRSVAQLVLIDGAFDTLPGVVAEGRRVISNIEKVANLFVTKTIYALFLAVATGFVGRAFPFLPRHLTLVGSVTIGIPAFFLALAPSAQRARPGFVMRVLRFSIPTGLAAGIATYGVYELAISEKVSLVQAQTTATFVLAAIGLFAIGMVSRPLVSWKRWLIGSMAGVLVILVVTPSSQEFFQLRLPGITMILASIGVIAVTGTVMIGTLFAVGWMRHFPELIRTAPPPTETRLWRQLQNRFQTWRSSGAAGDGTGMEWEPSEDPAGFGSITSDEDPIPGEIEWFDPDTDLKRRIPIEEEIDLLNRPSE